MHLTLSLLLLARQAEAAAAAARATGPEKGSPTRRQADEVVVEVVPGDADAEHGWCSVVVDGTTEELVIRSSARTWDRMSAVFEDGLDTGEVLRIIVPGRGTAARVAPLLREANPTLMIVDDPATNTILVSGEKEEV